MVVISRARLGRCVGLSVPTEIIVLSILGIVSTMFDASLLDFSGSLYKVWDIRMDPAMFSDRVELYMKYILTGIVLIRTFTAHIYLGCYIILLYPVLFEERPALMLPWMVINAIKCLLTGLMSLTAGLFTCAAYKFARTTCWEFLFTQFIDHAPSVYMFCLVMSYYKDLSTMLRVTQYVDPLELQARRRRTRLINEGAPASDSFGDKRGLISVSTIENVLQHFTTKLNKGTSRSLDTLLAQLKDDEERNEIMNVKDDTLYDDKSMDFNKKALAKISDDKPLIASWKGNETFLKSMIKLSGHYKGQLFANPVFDQCAYNVSLHSLLPYKSWSSFIHPLKENPPKTKRILIDAIPIPSETEVRTVLPESSTKVKNYELESMEIVPFSGPANKADHASESTGAKHSSWIQTHNVQKKKVSLKINSSNESMKNSIKCSVSIPTTAKPRKKTNVVPITEYYKNTKSYPKSYTDDGYTQAFFESINKSTREESGSQMSLK